MVRHAIFSAPMPIRPPKAFAQEDNLKKDPLTAALEHEVLAEKAATYGRLLARLEKALEALREFERAHASAPPAHGSAGARHKARRPFGLASLRSEERTGEDEYESLLATAGEALWHVVIQRDLCGFRNHELFYQVYGIPAAVRLRMGLRPRQGQ